MIYYYVKATILSDRITYQKNLPNLSLADRRGNKPRTSVRQLTTGRPIPCSIQLGKAGIAPYYLPPRGQQEVLAGE